MTASSLRDPWDGRTARAVAELLRRPRYEVLALPGTAERVVRHVPREVTVTVTVSARRGLEPTIALSEELTRQGFTAVPHIAARLVRDARHLAEVFERLDEAGVDEVFVIGGDQDPPVGELSEAMQVLAGAGRQRIGVAAYPEGHPKISDPELDQALLAKRPRCAYAVTQMCFDPGAVHRWMWHVRELGFDRPVHLGTPGPVDTVRLARVATRIGVGPSLRYALKQRGSARLLRPGGYRPDALLAGAVDAGIAGVHVYTLDDVAATERWRQSLLEMADA